MLFRSANILQIQYRPQALQHLHVHKLCAIWQISTKNPHKNLACKFLHELLHADLLHGNLSVLLWWLILLIKIHASCMYFFTTKYGWCKIWNWHCGKRLFVVKEETTYYTLSLIMIMLRSRTSCFVINDSLGCWLKCCFTCKLGCMLLAMTVVLKWVQCFSLHSSHLDFSALFCFFRLVYNTLLKHGSSYQG